LDRAAEFVKTIGAALGAASLLAYGCGYLVLRARASALGTDPAFLLVDQVYVFAGVRFLAMTLIIAVLLAPAFIVLRWAAIRLIRALPAVLREPILWIALAAVATTTLGSLVILTADGVLLRDAAPPTVELSGPELLQLALDGAVLGGSGDLRLALSFASVLLAGLSALWLDARMQSGAGTLGFVLAGVAALQLFMLPVYHGALFADRRVRVLAEMPEAVRGLVTPIAVVDRTAAQATLFGRDGAGRPRLITVALSDLDGVPVEAVIPLEDFVRPTPLGAQTVTNAAVAGWVLVADAGAAGDGEVAASEVESEFTKSFYGSLREYFGMVMISLGSLGGGPEKPGTLWVVELEPDGQPSKPRRVGDLDDLAWPVVDAEGRGFVAVQDGRVVRLDRDGAVVAVVAESGGWRKLLGVQADGAVLGLLHRDGAILPARIAADGTVTTGSAADGHRQDLARLLQDARAYEGGVELIVERSERGGRGLDVFLRSKGGTVNLSDCGDDYCGQAALSPDRRRAVFIQSPRF
jgi:hypothetical protein